jgi:hypothetical protein
MFFDLRKDKEKKNVIEDESSGNDRCFIKRERMNYKKYTNVNSLEHSRDLHVNTPYVLSYQQT